MSILSPVRPSALAASLAAALLAGCGAFAQTPAPAAGAAPGPAASAPAPRDMASMRQRMEQRMERHMADLKQALQLTPAQEPAWSQFTAAMRPPQSPMARPDPEAMKRLATPERIDQMRAMRQQRDAEMDRRAEATKTFYAQLTPEQKKRFDDHTARMFDRMGRGGGHHHGHHHGGMHEGMHPPGSR